jgi:hypothetical protein
MAWVYDAFGGAGGTGSLAAFDRAMSRLSIAPVIVARVSGPAHGPFNSRGASDTRVTVGQIATPTRVSLRLRR